MAQQLQLRLTTMTAPLADVDRTRDLPPDEIVFGSSEAMRRVQAMLSRASETDVPVLLFGETGTGKELLAKLLHYKSPLRLRPFVKVNCAALPSTLFESELFGYEQGAFTGATIQKVGRVETANGGTLFLDELAELAPTLQAKLLYLLQDRQFSRLGGLQDRTVDVRIVCSTSHCLAREIEAGTFRSDLLYRVNVIEIRVPPLSERRDDIPLLAEYFASMYARRFGLPRPVFAKEDLQVLRHRHWPGNIRELENTVARYVVFGKDVSADCDNHVVDELVSERLSLKQITKQAVHEVEREVIFRVLRAHQWNRRRAAEVLNISYRALQYKMRQAGLPRKQVKICNAATLGSEGVR